MATLDEIPKDPFFKVPDGYFERLPGEIQARVSRPEKHRAPTLLYALRYAVPMLIIGMIVYLLAPSKPTAESILATVDTQEMVDYLQESMLTTEDVLETVDWSTLELESIEDELYEVALPETDTLSLDL